MNAFTRLSCGSQSCVPSSEQESWTMCSNSTPCWSATDAMHSLSQLELRKLGVMMENFMLAKLPRAKTAVAQTFLEKYPIVLAKPSLKETLGDQPRIFLALVMSGRRCLGSSCGSGRKTILLLDLVVATISSANCNMVISVGLP